MHRKLISLLLLLPFSELAQDTKPNFSGTWKSRAFFPATETDWLDHKESVVTIMTKVGIQDVIYPETYTIDGRGSTNNAHWEGRTLVLDGKVRVHGVRRGAHVTLSLSEDGKVMTKTVHFLTEKRLDEQQVFDKISDHVGPIGFRMGESIADVEKDWGTPDKVVEVGNKTVLYYKNLEIIFVDGKVVDGQAAQPELGTKP